MLRFEVRNEALLCAWIFEKVHDGAALLPNNNAGNGLPCVTLTVSCIRRWEEFEAMQASVTIGQERNLACRRYDWLQESEYIPTHLK